MTTDRLIPLARQLVLSIADQDELGWLADPVASLTD